MGDLDLPDLLITQKHPVGSLNSIFQELLQDIPLYNHVLNYTWARGENVHYVMDHLLTNEEI